ncbi:MBL fold metallo-hydrolase [SAR202 cluster bacterium AD-804-J14_MRT_500m]|nr:MBL fold metallo-hydrolase [SAR202 cluster bacterium AD-804-J14_MRT_500m]
MQKYSISIGSAELISVSDGFPRSSPIESFPNTSIDQWQEFPDLLDKNQQITSRYGSVVIRSQEKLILVDTGLQADDGVLLDDMMRKGVDCSQIDVVVFTHLHPDHVGWNLTNDKPNFPNARYLVPKADWSYWTEPTILAKSGYIDSQVIPLDELGIMDLIDPGYLITDELTTISTPGHTPGHISIAIQSQGERGYVLGDVAHSTAQAHYTDWSPVYDVDQDISRRTRHEVLDMLEAESILVSAGHFPDPGFGRFLRGASRRYWQGI